MALDNFMSLWPRVANFRWDQASKTNRPLIDAAAIIRAAEEKNNIAGLFDETIKLATELVSRDEIDSRAAKKALRDVIATLELAKPKSFQDRRMAAFAVSKFVQNLSTEIVEDIPGFGKVFKALKKTATQLDEAFREAEAEINTHVSEQMLLEAKQTTQLLENKAPKQLEYHGNPEENPDVR